MGQQQIRVSISLGTKLLVSVLLLLLLVIVGINSATLWILRQDKQAYTLDSLSSEATLVGREIVGLSKRALDQLRLVLTEIDPRKPLSSSAQSTLQKILENQQELLQIRIDFLKLDRASITTFARAVRSDLIEAEGWKPEQSMPDTEKWTSLLPQLLKDGYGFLNVSYPGGPPVIAVFFADLKLKDHAPGMPVAWGVLSVRSLSQELKAGRFSIQTQNGAILFDADLLAHFNSQAAMNEADTLLETARQSPLAQGSKDYAFHGERWLGSFYRPGLGLIVLNRIGWNKVMEATFALTEKFVFLGLLALGLGIAFSIVFARRLTAPILRLFEATKRVAMGDFRLNLVDVNDRSRGDEINALTQSFQVMSGKITDLIQESMKKVTLENELAIASAVQQNLIPPAHFENGKIHIRSHYQSASECGGDWWGFFGVGNRISLMIADATGHGLPSALITAAARSCFSVMAKLAQEDSAFAFSPGGMLSYANRVVYDASLGKINMTFFIAVLDLDAQTLSYSNAGHNPPWLFQNRDGKFVAKSLMAQGPRLGEKRDVVDFEEQTVSIQPQDILFLYTDGLVEGKNSEGEQFGKKRVRKIVEEKVAQGPEQIVQDLVAQFLAHNGTKPLDDDLTIAAAQIRAGGTA